MRHHETYSLTVEGWTRKRTEESHLIGDLVVAVVMALASLGLAQLIMWAMG